MLCAISYHVILDRVEIVLDSIKCHFNINKWIALCSTHVSFLLQVAPSDARYHQSYETFYTPYIQIWQFVRMAYACKSLYGAEERESVFNCLLFLTLNCLCQADILQVQNCGYQAHNNTGKVRVIIGMIVISIACHDQNRHMLFLFRAKLVRVVTYDWLYTPIKRVFLFLSNVYE